MFDYDDFISVAKIIGLFALVILISLCSVMWHREQSGMIKINGQYCYEEDSKIIYIESVSYSRYGDKTSYTPYYDENGKLNRYDVETRKWIPVDGEEVELIE